MERRREEDAAALKSLLFSVPELRRATFFRHLTFLSDPAYLGSPCLSERSLAL